MIEFSFLLITLVKEFVGLVKVCVECYLAYVALKKYFIETSKKGKTNSTNSRKRADHNNTPSKKNH